MVDQIINSLVGFAQSSRQLLKIAFSSVLRCLPMHKSIIYKKMEGFTLKFSNMVKSPHYAPFPWLIMWTGVQLLSCTVYSTNISMTVFLSPLTVSRSVTHSYIISICIQECVISHSAIRGRQEARKLDHCMITIEMTTKAEK